MNTKGIKTIILADDDEDDRSFFKEALQEVTREALLTITRDGAELMKTLDKIVPPEPYVIFLDLNMPRKNGLECLKEIRGNGKLKKIPVVIFSTSDSSDSIEKTYELGANYYIRKPRSFALLKKAIYMVLTIDLVQAGNLSKDKYLLKIA